jgi:hypothetical protein
MFKSISSVSKVFSLIAILSILGGCAATQVALSKKDLDVQARTSTAIFVDSVAKDKRTIFVDVKSGVMEFDRRAFKTFVAEQFLNNDNGYRLVDDPDQAQFTMVAYVLNLEKTSPTAAESALHQGYSSGALLAGAVAGGVLNNSNPLRGAAAGGLLFAAADMIAGSLVKDVTYMLVCDIMIKERTKNGAIVRKDTQIDRKVSDAGSSRQTSSEVSNKKEYQTRIVTTANKVNLTLEEAKDLMFKKTAYAMSGFF